MYIFSVNQISANNIEKGEQYLQINYVKRFKWQKS